MPLSAKQRKVYWARVRRAWQTHQELGDRDLTIDEFRAELHHDAGVPDSTSRFGNRDLDRVFAKLDLYSIIDGSMSPIIDRETEQPLHRLRHVISRTGLPPAYIERIARNKFGVSDWRRLREDQLRHLLYTLQARERSRREIKAAAR